MVIAMLDSGIHGDHPSFAEESDDGYIHTNPLGDGVFLGECDPNSEFYNPAVSCNNKLIGRYVFLDNNESPEDSSEDTVGHGSHVSSIAGGNLISEAPVVNIEGEDTGLTLEMSGVAPRANIIMIQVCTEFCTASDRVAAVEQIIMDGQADVINHSIGITVSVPLSLSPWEDSVDLAFFIRHRRRHHRRQFRR